MPDENFNPGCRIEPAPAGIPSIEPLLGAGELPVQFIVPHYRGLFDADFKRTAVDHLLLPIKNQGTRPSCVGQAGAYMKAADEGEEISARDGYRQAKTFDGTNDPLSWGTSIWAIFDAMVQNGIAAETVVPEPDPVAGLPGYVSQLDVTDAVRASRAGNKATKPFFVPRTDIQRTLHQYQKPLVTSATWYTIDNAIAADGMMKMPSGSSVGGHAFACIGWVLRGGAACLVMLNSFGKYWGDRGVFYVPLLGVVNRLGNAYTALDAEDGLTEVLAKYSGKDVRLANDPKLWRIENGKRRHYPDEIVWWAHGRLFGFDTYEITLNDMSLIPVGAPVSIDEAPWKTRELVRQIRQHFGAL